MQAIKQRIQKAMWRGREDADATKFWQKQLDRIERWEAASPVEKNAGVLHMADYLEGLRVILAVDEGNTGAPIPWGAADIDADK